MMITMIMTMMVSILVCFHPSTQNNLKRTSSQVVPPLLRKGPTSLKIVKRGGEIYSALCTVQHSRRDTTPFCLDFGFDRVSYVQRSAGGLCEWVTVLVDETFDVVHINSTRHHNSDQLLYGVAKPSNTHTPTYTSHNSPTKHEFQFSFQTSQ